LGAGALGVAFAWTAEAAVATWSVVWPGFWVGEFLIVEIRLLHDNSRARTGFNQQSSIQPSSIGLLGRRLMVGQVPLEHFV
jgi:hypothetical protein